MKVWAVYWKGMVVWSDVFVVLVVEELAVSGLWRIV